MAKMTYEESIESLDARIEQLRARRRDEIARHERRERSARACARTATSAATSRRPRRSSPRRTSPRRFLSANRVDGARRRRGRPSGAIGR